MAYIDRNDHCRYAGHASSYEEHIYLLRRCGCRRCYDEFNARQMRGHSETTYIENMQITPGITFAGPVQAINVDTKQLMSGDNMNLVQKVKNLKLSAADKLLRKHDVVDAEGDLTDIGQDLIWAKLLDAYKDDLVADLKAVDAETKKK